MPQQHPQEIRNLGSLAWRDPRAWMEAMRGPRWRALVTRERATFEAALQATGAGKEELEAAISAFEAAEQEADQGMRWQLRHGLAVTPQAGGEYLLSWGGGDKSPKPLSIGDLAFGPHGLLAYTRDAGRGALRYELYLQKLGGGAPRRHVPGPAGGVGQQVAIRGGRLYILEADTPLRYTRLVSRDAETGAARRVLFEEEDPSVTLALVKGEGECLFLMRENAGRQALYVVEAGGVRRLSPDGIAFHAVGRVRGGEPCYFVRRGDHSAPWEACGTPLKEWGLPRGLAEQGIDDALLGTGLLITREGGRRHLYICRPRARPRHLQTMIGTLSFHPWERWAGGLGRGGAAVDCKVEVPGVPPTPGRLLGPEGLSVQSPTSIYGGARLTGTASSADGTPVPWLLCWNQARAPRALIVSVYGAYGLPSYLETSRWKPFLERGVAIGFALVRGGGDGSESWAEAGRRQGKLRGVEDTEACVRAMRRVLGIPAQRTCLYGRSAGGYMVGATVARNPRGGLFGIAYAEVPYTDILRTASNPTLPLTEYEYLEFGDPARRIEDVETLLRLGPIDSLGPEGAPGVMVLCRTAENDTQVYPYESFKWIDALRGAGGGAAAAAPKLVAMTDGAGHFVHGTQRYIEQAEDYLLLCEKMLK